MYGVWEPLALVSSSSSFLPSGHTVGLDVLVPLGVGPYDWTGQWNTSNVTSVLEDLIFSVRFPGFSLFSLYHGDLLHQPEDLKDHCKQSPSVNPLEYVAWVRKEPLLFSATEIWGLLPEHDLVCPHDSLRDNWNSTQNPTSHNSKFWLISYCILQEIQPSFKNYRKFSINKSPNRQVGPTYSYSFERGISPFEISKGSLWYQVPGWSAPRAKKQETVLFDPDLEFSTSRPRISR